MEIKPICDLLKANNLAYPSLAVLQSNENLYTALLVQPKAEIEVGDDFIRNADREGAQAMFEAIAQKAFDESIELLVTPEYSFPWESIESLLRRGVAPKSGDLWVLGCESLPLAELPNLKNRFARWADVLHETPNNPPSTARYLNPLVYLFRSTRLNSGEQRLVMVVQFKTCPSGDSKNTEATRMAKGNDVYLFEQKHEVRLFTIICSDAFEFTDALIKEHYENILLIHLQLNEKPRDERYMRYRRQLYEFDHDCTELICLNWAKNIVFTQAGVSNSKNNISASAWHSKSGRFDTDDAHIEKNHGYGVYYTRDKVQRRHMLHFTYEPAAFLLQTTKAYVRVPATSSRRRGPELTGILRWDSKKTAWAPASTPIDDGFLAMTASHGAPATDLDACYRTSLLAVERLACITKGDFGPSENWHEATSLPTMHLQDRTEVMQRITVAIDPDGHPIREQYVRTVKALRNIPLAKLPLPNYMKDIKNGYNLKWEQGTPHYNVTSSITNQRAALIYAGESPSNDNLDRLYNRALATVHSSSQPPRFCVLYSEGLNIKRYEPKRANSITQANLPTGKDFMEPGK